MQTVFRVFCIVSAVAALINVLCLPAQYGLPAEAYTLWMAAVGHGLLMWVALRWAFPNGRLGAL